VGGVTAEPRYPLAEAIARIGADRATAPQPRPAPFYLRGADAAPPADPPPVILP
jgi:tRNA threonylcarbamoyladenosine biosynthesis protein TsaB